MVRRIVWPWDAPAPRPTDVKGKLRRKALIQALVIFAVATAVFYYWGKGGILIVLLVMGSLDVSLGLFAPHAFGVLDRWLQTFGRWCGQAVTWLLLAPFFYLFFVPARAMLAIRGRDPMQRRFPDKHATYWITRRPVTNLDDYRKQF